MLVFEEQHRDIAGHTDAAAANSQVTFNVHSSIFIACHILLDAM
jgi:hypothetical protein